MLHFNYFCPVIHSDNFSKLTTLKTFNVKKFYFLVMAFLLTTLSYGQMYLFEDFSSNAMPPAGWTIDGVANKWSASATNNAGGDAPEAKFSYINQTNTSRLVSPVIDLTGVPNASISFKHFYDHFANNVDITLGVGTRFNNGNWNVNWQIDPIANVGPTTQVVDLSGLGQSGFQFCIFISGNLNNVDNWFIDDIKLFVPGELDAALTSVSASRYMETGSTFSLKGVVSNEGSTPINSFDVSYTVNDLAPKLYSVTGLNLALGDNYAFTHNAPITLPKIGAYTIVTTISNINGGQDMNPDNNTIEKVVKAVSFVPAKKVMAEEATGTWSAWCTRGICFMSTMRETYPDTWIGIAIHDDDPMVVPSYSAAIPQIIPGFNLYPGASTDRIPGHTDPDELEAGYNERKDVISPATLNIVNYAWNPVSREVSFDLQSEFVASIDSELRFGVIFVEDDVHGTTQEWNQENAYAGGMYGPMCGFENKPATIPAAQMRYNHVARAILDSPFGTPGSLPLEIAIGSVHTYSYTYTIPATWKYDKLGVVGFLVDMGTKEILNANNVISSFVGVNTPAFEKSVAVYPNPFNEYTNVTFILDKASKVGVEVLDIMGKTIYTITEGEYAAGQNNIRVNSNNLPNGMYILKITIDNQMITRKISVIN